MIDANNILSLVFIIGSFQGIILALLLFTKYRSTKANRILGWLMLLYSFFVLNNMFLLTPGLLYRFPHFVGLTSGLPFLFGPLHLIYVGMLSNTQYRFARFSWLHFIPFLLYKLHHIHLFFLSKIELNQYLTSLRDTGPSPIDLALGLVLAIQGLVYVIFALFVFREYANKIKQTFSSLEKINLSWLQYFTILAVIVWTIVLIVSILNIAHIDSGVIYILVPLLTSIFVYATGYIGMLKTEIFLQYEVYENIHEAQNFVTDSNQAKTTDSDSGKYQKSGLSQEKAEEYFNQLKKLMEEKHIYTDPDLTLKKLSGQLRISTHNISEVINTRHNTNFFEFINRYRVEKVKKDLLDKNKDYFTLFAIAMEAGFNSKSGFNAIFKRYTGQTPSEYRNSL